MVGAAGVAGGLCWVPTTSITYSSAFENPNYRAANGSAGAGVGSRPGSHNTGYVMRANSSALTLRLV